MPKFVQELPYANPEAAGRRLLQLAATVDHDQGWIHVEKVNGPFLFQDGGSPAGYSAGIRWLIETGRIEHHDSGCYFTLTQMAKDDLFA